MAKQNTTIHEHKRVHGFTLLEVIMYVALIGIAATILIPSMTHVASFETEAAVRRLVADLSFAQSDAMAHQQQRRVLFEDDGSGYRLLSYPFDPENDVLFDSLSHDGSGRYIIDYSSDDRWHGIVLDDVSFDSTYSYITYDEIGSPIASGGGSSSGGSLTITGEDETWEITVSAFTGRVSASRVEE